MATNDGLLAVRLPLKLKEDLESMYPDVAIRNNVIRAAIKKIVDRKIIITSYEISLQTNQ